MGLAARFFSSFRRKKRVSSSGFKGKIEIFSRHCLFSEASAHKKRYPQFSLEQCYRNLMETLDPEKANLTFFLDTARGPKTSHFLKNAFQYPVIEIDGGSEAASFLQLLDYLETLDLHPETIIYFLEDDYLHRPGWIEILLEGFQIESADYVTLYDHRDKYFLKAYENLHSKLMVTASTHWRTVPSTTNTFATRSATLKRDLSIHQRFSRGRTISADHEKFCALKRSGACLISPIPGWSTHAEPEFASPCINWEPFLMKNHIGYKEFL